MLRSSRACAPRVSSGRIRSSAAVGLEVAGGQLSTRAVPVHVSPRGPIAIDPETRDIIMNEYLSEVVKGKDGKLHQKVIGKIDNVKDACKAQKIAPCK